jgi:hypothetical protein
MMCGCADLKMCGCADLKMCGFEDLMMQWLIGQVFNQHPNNSPCIKFKRLNASAKLLLLISGW